MIIRRARVGDTEAVLKLLSQVLEVHAKIRPDIFQSGTTKYSAEELALMFENDDLPVYLALDDEGRLLGYAFCQIRRPAAAPSVMMTPMRRRVKDPVRIPAASGTSPTSTSGMSAPKIYCPFFNGTLQVQ